MLGSLGHLSSQAWIEEKKRESSPLRCLTERTKMKEVVVVVVVEVLDYLTMSEGGGTALI